MEEILWKQRKLQEIEMAQVQEVAPQFLKKRGWGYSRWRNTRFNNEYESKEY